MTRDLKKCFKFVLLPFLFCTGIAFSAQSQVTIGSDSTTPLNGALLDLKQADETSGAQNSQGGMVLPRVSLVAINSLSPVLTGTEPNYTALKLAYTGLVVYNVTNDPSASLTKGMYVWDGTQWTAPMSASAQNSFLANNGLTISGDTVGLGGNLIKKTTIDLGDNNLVFNRSNGNIEIGATTPTVAPQAILQVDGTTTIDPLVLRNLQYLTDPNPIDGASPTYYDLKISNAGVVRKEASSIIDPSKVAFFTLNANQPIAAATTTSTVSSDHGEKGGGGTLLVWQTGSASSDSIILPETGAYIFSFNLFGPLALGSSYFGASIQSVTDANTPQDASSFYLSAYKNNTGNNVLTTPPIDIAEIVITRTSGYNFASYTVTLTAAGNAGDKIYFKLSSRLLDSGNPQKFSWTLSAPTAANTARKTSMVFWKL